MGKSAGTPEAPDYFGLAKLQGEINKDTFNQQLHASRNNSVTPWGTTSWEYTPGAPSQAPGTPYTPQTPDNVAGDAYGYTGYLDAEGQFSPGGGQGSFTPQKSSGVDQHWAPTDPGKWTMRQTLSPEQQQLFDYQQKSQLGTGALLDSLTQRANSSLGKDLDTSGLPAAYGQDAADAYYNKATRYLQPGWDTEKSQLEARLGEQGFVPGTPAYNNAMESLRRTQDLAKGQAADQAVIGGTDTGIRSRQAALAEMLTQRALPLQELLQMRGASQPGAPGFGAPQNPVPGLQGPDMMGAAQEQYKAQLDASNAANASNNQLMGSLGQMAMLLASKGAIFSDARLKEDITYTGEHIGEIPLATFRYKGSSRKLLGVIAQDVLKVKPSAVRTHASGFLMVDYGALQ